MQVPIIIYDTLSDPTKMSRIAEVDEYSSVTFTRSWSDAGSFTIILNYNSTFASYFQRGYFIQLGDDQYLTGVITEIEDNSGESGRGTQKRTIKGKELKWLLSRRIAVPGSSEVNYTIAGKAETVIKNAITQVISASATTVSRRIPYLTVEATSGSGIDITLSARYKTMFDELKKISEMSKIGWGIKIIDSSLVAWTGTGLDRSNTQNTNPGAIFSNNLDTLKNATVKSSEIQYKNFLYCAGQGTGTNRNVQTGYSGGSEPTGILRHEGFLDSRDLNSTSKLNERLTAKLTELSVQDMIDGSVLIQSPLILREDYDLGDIVNLDVYDRLITARITSVTESWAYNKYSINVTFDKQYPQFNQQVSEKIEELTNIVNNSEAQTEIGSNSNGSYIKFNDGTMIQFGVVTQNINVNNAVGSGFYGTGPTVTFPIPFVGSIPSFTVSGSVLWSSSFSSLSITQVTINATYFVSTSGTFGFHWIAIGKWK